MSNQAQPSPVIVTRRAESNRDTLAGAGLADLPLITDKHQLAAALRVSPKHVENLTARGLLHPVRLGRSVRFRRDTVLRDLGNMEGTAA